VISTPRRIGPTVRPVALLSRSLFARACLARNIAVQPHAFDDFLAGKNMPDAAIGELVTILFHGKARWDPEMQALADVVKPVQAMIDLRNMA
jgi:hypothetical protein